MSPCCSSFLGKDEQQRSRFYIKCPDLRSEACFDKRVLEPSLDDVDRLAWALMGDPEQPIQKLILGENSRQYDQPASAAQTAFHLRQSAGFRDVFSGKGRHN